METILYILSIIGITFAIVATAYVILGIIFVLLYVNYLKKSDYGEYEAFEDNFSHPDNLE